MKRRRKASAKKIVFSFDSPTAGEVFVAGTFNNWEPRTDPLRKNAKGWSAVKYLEPGTYEYRFIADGIWRVWMTRPVGRVVRINTAVKTVCGENCVLDV